MRRVAVAASAVLLAMLPANAHAGTYDVVACSGAAGGVAEAFQSVAAPGMDAYKICPNQPSNPASGLVTRATAAAGPAKVPYFAGAYQIFEAPAGAALESVTFDHSAIRLNQHWTTGLVAYDGDFNSGDLPYGCYAWGSACGIGTPSFFGPVHVALNGRSRFRFETRCNDLAGCDISASGFTLGMRAMFAAANVVVRVRDSTPPAIVPVHGTLWRDGWHRGYEDAWQQLTDNVGVMSLRLYADGQLVTLQDYRDPHWPGHVQCNFTRPRPCHDIAPGGVALDTRALSDGDHSFRIESVDAAGNVSGVERWIRVDNTAPVHVVASVAGGEAWRRTNDFAVHWAPPAADGGAPITRAHYVVCPLSRPGSCVQGSSEGPDPSSASSIRVSGPGEHAVRVWLEDAAGNASRDNASPPVTLRFDDVAPEGAFELLDERDPRRLDVRVTDEGSGVSNGAIEIRRAGHRQWHELDAILERNFLSAHVDDVALGDGTYEARAIVRDQAGNERVTDRREDGARMSLSLPVRIRTRIAVAAGARTSRCRRRARRGRRCVRLRPAALLRGPGIVRGRVTSESGEPLPGAALTVTEQPRIGGALRRTGAVRTDGDGRFTHRVARGPSRTVRFHYVGTPRLKPSAAEVRVRVPARSSIAVSRRYLLNGQAVDFTGRLLQGPVPDGGKLIDLQAFFRSRWRTIATPRADERGNWRFRYRFEATSGLVRYRFRARVRREAAYPYELGYSRPVTVTVRGP